MLERFTIKYSPATKGFEMDSEIQFLQVDIAVKVVRTRIDYSSPSIGSKALRNYNNFQNPYLSVFFPRIQRFCFAKHLYSFREKTGNRGQQTVLGKTEVRFTWDTADKFERLHS